MQTLVVSENTTGSEVAQVLKQGGRVQISSTLLEKMKGFEETVRALMAGRKTSSRRDGDNFIITARRHR